MCFSAHALPRSLYICKSCLTIHRVLELFERLVPVRTSRSVPFDFGERVTDAIVRFRGPRASVHEGDDSGQCDREGDHEGYHERDRDYPEDEGDREGDRDYPEDEDAQCDSQCDRGRR